MRVYVCNTCGTKMSIPDDYPSKLGKCIKCGAIFDVQPQVAAAPAPAAGTSALDDLASAVNPTTSQAYVPPTGYPQQPPVQPGYQTGGYSRAMPLVNAPGAVAAMVCGIIGLFCFGVIFGIIALCLGVSANGKIRANPQMYGGGGMATTGVVLGIIDIIGGIIIVLVWLSAMSIH